VTTDQPIAAAHQPMTLLVGGEECLDRECDDYFTEDGESDPGVERCSHIREEQVCGPCTGQPEDGSYDQAQTVPWTPEHAALNATEVTR
jgi:hypothetical protein